MVPNSGCKQQKGMNAVEQGTTRRATGFEGVTWGATMALVRA